MQRRRRRRTGRSGLHTRGAPSVDDAHAQVGRQLQPAHGGRHELADLDDGARQRGRARRRQPRQRRRLGQVIRVHGAQHQHPELRVALLHEVYALRRHARVVVERAPHGRQPCRRETQVEHQRRRVARQRLHVHDGEVLVRLAARRAAAVPEPQRVDVAHEAAVHEAAVDHGGDRGARGRLDAVALAGGDVPHEAEGVHKRQRQHAARRKQLELDARQRVGRRQLQRHRCRCHRRRQRVRGGRECQGRVRRSPPEPLVLDCKLSRVHSLVHQEGDDGADHERGEGGDARPPRRRRRRRAGGRCRLARARPHLHRHRVLRPADDDALHARHLVRRAAAARWPPRAARPCPRRRRLAAASGLLIHRMRRSPPPAA
mmetsp:Transcript_12020/g.42139  ORF Transcript_12020/g.42139 Transcript_12020/m.42139 type:complete len:373 (-) Transcript_12020:105-1223(-)